MDGRKEGSVSQGVRGDLSPSLSPFFFLPLLS